MITTYSHGETPYLVLKGHISEIKSMYGPSGEGMHSVTVSGYGYEKILKDNIVYYDDLNTANGVTSSPIENVTIYQKMMPPKALMHFIENSVPRYILISNRPSDFVTDTKNQIIDILRPISPDQIAVEEGQQGEEGINSTTRESPPSIYDDYLPEGKILARGLITHDLNSANSLTREGPSSVPLNSGTISIRIFYPVNYINISRIREMISVMTEAFKENPEDSVIAIPISIASKVTVAANMAKISGPQEINHLFVDETGRVRQRISFEAWERTPVPAYIPTITDSSVFQASFSRDSSSIVTMVDIRANIDSRSAGGYVDALFAGRIMSQANDYIPILAFSSDDPESGRVFQDLYKNNYEIISEPFFRYGMRYGLMDDVYSSSTTLAKRKSILYHGFFSKPIKKAEIVIKGDPSYRAGETVLVVLDSYRQRSKEIINVEKTLNWLNSLKNEGTQDMQQIYIGVDTRWNNSSYYYETNGNEKYTSYFPFMSGSELTTSRVLNWFIDTFSFLNSLGIVNITPEYFPTTYWYFNDGSEVRNAYKKIYESLLNRNSRVKDYFSSEKGPDIFKNIKMQNFKATSYYINSVSHSYSHGESISTNLNLDHGQDNLVLIDPVSNNSIGFLSVEKKFRLYYDDSIDDGQLYTPQKLLWEDYGSKTLSNMQTMYIEQFKQDRDFKLRSFLYSAQSYRNSSNFLYELALDMGITK
jgi:hypothetical protein